MSYENFSHVKLKKMITSEKVSVVERRSKLSSMNTKFYIFEVCCWSSRSHNKMHSLTLAILLPRFFVHLTSRNHPLRFQFPLMHATFQCISSASLFFPFHQLSENSPLLTKYWGSPTFLNNRVFFP